MRSKVKLASLITFIAIFAFYNERAFRSDDHFGLWSQWKNSCCCWRSLGGWWWLADGGSGCCWETDPPKHSIIIIQCRAIRPSQESKPVERFLIQFIFVSAEVVEASEEVVDGEEEEEGRRLHYWQREAAAESGGRKSILLFPDSYTACLCIRW